MLQTYLDFLLPAFETFMRIREDFVKPVYIFNCNSGPDEHPRYEPFIVSTVQHFKDFHLNTIYVATNSSERIAFNRLER